MRLQHRSEKSPLLIWTCQESHLKPFRSSCRSQDQLWFVSLKYTAQSCHCHNQEENTNYPPAAERERVRVKQTNTKKASLQRFRSCWKTGVSVSSRACFCIAMSWEAAVARQRLLLQTKHLKACCCYHTYWWKCYAVGLFCCQWICCCKESIENNEDGGLAPNSTWTPKIANQKFGSCKQLGIPTGQWCQTHIKSVAKSGYNCSFGMAFWLELDQKHVDCWRDKSMPGSQQIE